MNNKPNNNIDKQNYLIKNIFLTSNYSVPINTIRINNDINGFNFNTINNIINKQILNKISSNKSLTLFNKTYTNDSFDKFMKKFNKLIYFCYRKNMHPINTRLNISITRDSGWGCMIRCGQMIMSRAIYKYLKAEKYTTEKAITETIKLFLDIPYDTKNIPNFFTYIMSKNPYINTQMAILSPFGLHMNCSLGKIYNKYAGEWFSDVNICQNYRDLNNYLNIIPNLKIFSFISSIDMGQVMEECFTLIDKFFLYHWLDSNSFKDQAMNNLHGSTMTHITKGIIENVHIVFPSIPDQHRIVAHLDSLSEKVKSLESNLNKVTAECAALKQSILRQVFE